MRLFRIIEYLSDHTGLQARDKIHSDDNKLQGVSDINGMEKTAAISERVIQS
jgi:hypothetical protein